jgi:mycoredoxin
MTSQITMYSGDWCGDCRRSKRLMDSLGVKYHEIDVETNPDAAQKVRDYNGGHQSIPVIVFSDGTHLTEPSDIQLKSKLEELALI